MNDGRRSADAASPSGLGAPALRDGLLLRGSPLTLSAYPASPIPSRHVERLAAAPFSRVYLPPAMSLLMDAPALETRTFIEDDNRGAIRPDPIATIDGTEFYLSVKGIGSMADPYSTGALDRTHARELTDDPEVRRRWGTPASDGADPVITGELWLRGSPYGGQGLEHARAALAVSDRADLTSIAGFRIAPVVAIVPLPATLEERVREIHWYRRYPGRIVQELRLVPSNVRIYFHSRTTLGGNVRHVFDLFGVRSDVDARRFELNFVRSAIPLLTLFARTMAPSNGRFVGLDFHDVWLDKDAVIAPDGTAYFVDLEGIAEVAVDRSEVGEKLDDQFYRALYEFMFAFEQIEAERTRRFGPGGSRKRTLEAVVEAALADDRFVRPVRRGRSLEIEVRNNLDEPGLNRCYPMVDG